MQFPDSVLVVIAVINAAAVGYLAWRARGVVRLLHELKEAVNKPRGKDGQSGHGKGGHLDDRAIQKIQALITDKFTVFDGNMTHELEIMKRSIEKLGAQLNPAPPKPQTLPAAVAADTPAVAPGAPMQPPNRFASELTQAYNRSPDDFRTRFNAKTAQLQGKQLVPHDAGSFWIVESRDGDSFCVPRTRKITPIDHDNVGLKVLFSYDGYDPNGPDRDIYMEQPATVMASSGSGWTLRDRGCLRFSEQEA